MLTLDEFHNAVEEAETPTFDTVVIAAVNMHAQLIGKHQTAKYFLEKGYAGQEACDGLLTTDIENSLHLGYTAASFENGFKNFVFVPDYETGIRIMPWREKTALVLCDLKEKLTLNELEHSPRRILKRQIERLSRRGYRSMFASELEFYVFTETYKSCREKRWTDLDTLTPHKQPLALLPTSFDEKFFRKLRNDLCAAGISVESSFGEYSPGQHEFNIQYTDALTMADNHVLLKHACHEIANLNGRAITFMAKPKADRSGNSCHIHHSLWSTDGQTALFYDPDDEFGMSQLAKSWLAGQLKYALECMYFLAPYINSYKRICSGNFAPSRLCWGLDNRTTPFRVCGEKSESIRVECRIGGGDLNPYLAYAVLIAAGLAGIDEELELDPPFNGNAYTSEELEELPKTFRESVEKFANSDFLKKTLGEEVFEHYLHTARLEQSTFDQQVTEWELMRGFERS